MQAKQILTQPSLTYKTRENAVKKIEKEVAKCDDSAVARYVIGVTAEGRFFPVAIGAATSYLVHHGVCVAG